MKNSGSEKLLVLASAIALPALGLMAFSIFVPTPAPVLLAMSVAQGLGGLAFTLYLLTVLRTMRSRPKTIRPPADPDPTRSIR